MERSTNCLFALKLPWQGDFSVYIPAQELSFYSIKNLLTTQSKPQSTSRSPGRSSILSDGRVAQECGHRGCNRRKMRIFEKEPSSFMKNEQKSGRAHPRVLWD